jgi:hypothetical protein
VPADGSEAVIKQGQEVAVNLIRSIVESEVAKKQQQQQQQTTEATS